MDYISCRLRSPSDWKRALTHCGFYGEILIGLGPTGATEDTERRAQSARLHCAHCTRVLNQMVDVIF